MWGSWSRPGQSAPALNTTTTWASQRAWLYATYSVTQNSKYYLWDLLLSRITQNTGWFKSLHTWGKLSLYDKSAPYGHHDIDSTYGCISHANGESALTHWHTQPAVRRSDLLMSFAFNSSLLSVDGMTCLIPFKSWWNALLKINFAWIKYKCTKLPFSPKN